MIPLVNDTCLHTEKERKKTRKYFRQREATGENEAHTGSDSILYARSNQSYGMLMK